MAKQWPVDEGFAAVKAGSLGLLGCLLENQKGAWCGGTWCQLLRQKRAGGD